MLFGEKKHRQYRRNCDFSLNHSTLLMLSYGSKEKNVKKNVKSGELPEKEDDPIHWSVMAN